MHLVLIPLLRYMRPVLLVMASVNIIGSALWISSIFVEYPQRYAVLWVAISVGIHSNTIHLTIDWFGYIGFIILIRGTPRFSMKLGDKLKNIFAYYPGSFISRKSVANSSGQYRASC
jgi:hypothetical protein